MAPASRSSCDDARRGRAAHDRVVDHDHALAVQVLDDRIELQMHAARAHLLIGADERAADVAVLDQPLDVRQTALGRVADAAGHRRVGNRHHDVGVDRMLAARAARPIA